MVLSLAFNNFQQSTSGTTVTTGNSAGADGSNAFDTATFGTGATLAYSNAESVHSTQSCKVATGSTSTIAYVNWNTSGSLPSASTFYVRGYFYWTALPSANARLINVTGTGGSIASISLTLAGKIVVSYSSAGTGFVTFTTAISLNSWFRVEGIFVASATVGQVGASLYATPDSVAATETHTSAANLDTSTVNPEFLYFGNSANLASVGPYYMQDVAYSTSGYLGPSQFSGAASGAVSLAASAVGARRQSGAGTGALTLAAAATGFSRRASSPAAALSLAAAASGTRQQVKAASASLLLAATAAGRVLVIPAGSSPTVSPSGTGVSSVTPSAASTPAVGQPVTSSPVVSGG